MSEYNVLYSTICKWAIYIVSNTITPIAFPVNPQIITTVIQIEIKVTIVAITTEVP